MSLTGYLTSGGSDLSAVFMNINRGVSLTSSNVFQQKNKFLDGGIDLSGSLLYGRNNGSDFITGLTTPYPVGYTNTYTLSSQTHSSSTDISYSPVFVMSTGVWLLTIKAAITGIASWNVPSAYIQIYLPNPFSNPTNSITSRTRAGFIQHIPYNSTVQTPEVCTSLIITVTAPCRIIYNVSVYYSAGTASIIMSGGMTKLA